MANDFINPMNFLDPQFLMGVLEERQDFGAERGKYIGQRFFPKQNFPEQTVLWETIKKENRLAGVYSARGKAVPGDDIGFATHFANLVWIKAAKFLDPDTVQKIRDPGMVAVYKAGQSAFTVQGIYERIQQKMRMYLEFVDDQIAAQEEYFAMQAMQGTLVWPPRNDAGVPITPAMPEWNINEKIEITWPFTTKFVQNISTLAGVPLKTGLADRTGGGYAWNNASANPVKDFEVIGDMLMELKGVDIDGATAIMSRKALSYIAELESVQRWLRGTNYDRGDVYADNKMLKEKVKSMFGLSIETYDAKWTYVNGYDADGLEVVQSVRFLPADKMIIVPRGEKIGVLAQAPHETQQGQYVHGKVVHVHRDEKEPHTRELSASNVVFPLLQQPEAIGVFTVFS